MVLAFQSSGLNLSTGCRKFSSPLFPAIAHFIYRFGEGCSKSCNFLNLKGMMCTLAFFSFIYFLSLMNLLSSKHSSCVLNSSLSLGVGGMSDRFLPSLPEHLCIEPPCRINSHLLSGAWPFYESRYCAYH